MTAYICLSAGALLLLLAVTDFLCTTISLGGLGPVSSRVTTPLWRIGRATTLFAERRFGVSMRGAIGPTVLSALGATWILLHLAAYTLLYLAGSSLVSSETGAPATLVQIVAFAGSALSTLGASTVQPTNGWWDVLSMVAAVNGMVVLTLSVSFVLNIIQTTTSARQWAVRYNAAKRVSDQDMEEVLAQLGPELCRIVVDLTASPLTGVFVPDDPEMSFPKALHDLIDELERRALIPLPPREQGPELAQLVLGIELLGRHALGARTDTDLDAARTWAMNHALHVQVGK